MKVQRHDFLFRRLLTCKECGYHLTGERQKGHIYYRCHTRDCPTKGIREDRVERRIAAMLSRLEIKPDEFKVLRAKLSRFEASLENEREKIVANVQLAIGRQQERLDRLTDALIDGLVDKETFDQRKARLQMELLESQEKLSELQSNNHDTIDRMGQFFEFLKTAQSSYISGLPIEKRELLKQVTSNRYVSGKNVEIELREPFLTIANRSIVENGGPYWDGLRTNPSDAVADLFHTLYAHFEREAEAAQDAGL